VLDGVFRVPIVPTKVQLFVESESQNPFDITQVNVAVDNAMQRTLYCSNSMNDYFVVDKDEALVLSLAEEVECIGSAYYPELNNFLAPAPAPHSEAEPEPKPYRVYSDPIVMSQPAPLELGTHFEMEAAIPAPAPRSESESVPYRVYSDPIVIHQPAPMEQNVDLTTLDQDIDHTTILDQDMDLTTISEQDVNPVTTKDPVTMMVAEDDHSDTVDHYIVGDQAYPDAQVDRGIDDRHGQERKVDITDDINAKHGPPVWVFIVASVGGIIVVGAIIAIVVHVMRKSSAVHVDVETEQNDDLEAQATMTDDKQEQEVNEAVV